MNPTLTQPLDLSIKAYKMAQIEAQRNGTDCGTYPQWRAMMMKKDKFRQELVEANKPKEEVKPKRKPRAKKEKSE
ncbi:hypothetical protein vBValCWD615_46 [Vibrio phage vB_ValC_WD615]|nr:hypothetical protein [Vibrio phage vB_ValP_IME271]QBJ00576.1 hypothetical protein [Vibrio phage vB_VpP_BA6]QQM14242.1 hypothetical protein [Vibrio phage VpJYP1]WQZ00189.1 hypothetical protein vBValCWD615_46 [Vibrio phage vB_ValC_WD615]BBI55074.1 hypothetical protein KIT05_23 [Vibrio phage KIT05]